MNWRENWFVQNVLAEIPFIGPFFIEKDCYTAAGLAVKCSLMLLGSSVTMHLWSGHQHNSTELTQDTAVMTAGMTSGKIIYNCAKTVLFCLNRTPPTVISDSDISTDLEMQPLQITESIKTKNNNLSVV